MWNLSYMACSFVLKRKYKQAQRMDLWGKFENKNSGEQYANFFEVLSSYCSLHKSLEDNSAEKRLYRMNLIDEQQNEGLHYMLIEIESGRYGYKSEITDKDTQKVAYHQKESDAPLMKFYLTVVIPFVKDVVVYKGFMFFQNYGQYGIKTTTVSALKEYFSNNLDSIMWVGNISPEIFVKTMMKSENIRKLYFVRNNVSRDDADNINFTYGKEQRIIERIHFTENFISRMVGYLAGGSRVFEFENKEYENVKVELDIGGRKRTIGLNNIENVSIIESLPDDIKGSDGELDKDRLVSIICTQAKEYMKHVIYCEQR